MRTTLDIEDDVLAAAKELVRRQGISAGTVGPAPVASTPCVAGFRPFPAGAVQVVTNGRIDQLRDGAGL